MESQERKDDLIKFDPIQIALIRKSFPPLDAKALCVPDDLTDMMRQLFRQAGAHDSDSPVLRGLAMPPKDK